MAGIPTRYLYKYLGNLRYLGKEYLILSYNPGPTTATPPGEDGSSFSSEAKEDVPRPSQPAAA